MTKSPKLCPVVEVVQIAKNLQKYPKCCKNSTAYVFLGRLPKVDLII